MKKQHEAAASKHLRSPKAVGRFIVIFLMFCFAGCATGSCLSYGHSCWGAHGKRSYDGPGISQHRQIDTREVGRRTDDGETIDDSNTRNSQNRWFLTHLINRRLAGPAIDSMVKSHNGNRWPKRHPLLTPSGGWSKDYATTSDETFGNDKNEIDNIIEDSKDLDYSLDLSRKMAKPRESIIEVLGVPAREEYAHRYPSHTSKRRLYKIVTDSSADDDTL